MDQRNLKISLKLLLFVQNQNIAVLNNIGRTIGIKMMKKSNILLKIKVIWSQKTTYYKFKLFLCFKNIIFNFFDHTETALTSNICIYLYTNGKTMIWRHFSNSTLPGDTFGVSVLLWATVQKIFLLFFSNKPNFVHIRVSSLHI